MPELSESDDFQQNVSRRNQKLAQLLQVTWLGFTVLKVRRDPSDPPAPGGPMSGRWIAETL